MKTKVVLILVRRSLSSTPARVVYAHEIPILKVIKGAGNVELTDIDCSDCDLKPHNLKPREELIRLKNKYKGFINEGQHPVDLAYPDGSRDLELYYENPSVFDVAGEEEGGGLLEEESVPDHIMTDEGEEAVPPTSDITEQLLETDEVENTPKPELELPEPDVGINLNDRPSVLEALDKLEVPYAKTTATKHLAKLLTNSLEPGAVG